MSVIHLLQMNIFIDIIWYISISIYSVSLFKSFHLVRNKTVMNISNLLSYVEYDLVKYLVYFIVLIEWFTILKSISFHTIYYAKFSDETCEIAS